MTVFHMLVYLSLLIFFVAVIARIVRISRMPMHLRWELYPVPHERGRARYGGSILEEVDWWTKSRQKDTIGELKFMIPEILFLKGLWDHNRSLWFSSWMLHFGLYLLVGELGLLILAGLLNLAGVTGGLMSLLLGFITIVAWVGCVVGLIGVVLMYIRRLADPKMKPYNNMSHYFNLLLIGAICLTGALWIAGDSGYSRHLAEIFAGWISVSELPPLPTVAYWHVGLVLFFLVYFPFTHMTHAFVKWFTWHQIRWEDEPNVPGGNLEKQIEKLVQQPVSWSAPHVRGDGRKTWVDLVSETGARREEKTE